MANYEIRNVAEKEIYDSYMGIMRISPNPSNILNNNSKWIDDPTELLNSIVNVKNETQTEVILSDSDGNVLPITFIPKAKNTTVMIEGSEKTIPLINIVTKINDDAKLYIEENFKSYSTVWIDNNQENEKDEKKISSLQILTKSGINENVLLYPIDSPNDSSYFNDKNRLKLVNYEDVTKSKREQFKENLHKKKYSWYTSNFEKNVEEGEIPEEGKLYTDDNYVSLNGEQNYITTFNEKGELVPVLYTKDYVLGHYDGHSINLDEINTSIAKTDWIGSESRLFENSSLKGATKLSWIRIDNLIWDIIGSVLRGDLRHTKGRYSGLGSEETDNIDVLFEGGKCTLHDNVDSGSDWMEKTAPMLGQGVQEGLIIYNAIPFSRYMFHVARQMCTNMLYQFGIEEKIDEIIDDITLDEETKKNRINNIINNSSWKLLNKSNFNEIAETLRIAIGSEKITPASKGALSTTQSLSKDFLLCDGKEINYENYPNINITNRKLFEIDSNKFYPIPENNIFKEIFISSSTDVYEAMRNSNIEKKFETPHLYVLNEDAPRFLRGLNWTLDEIDFDKYKGQEDVVSFNNVKNNYGGIASENESTLNVSVDDENLNTENDLRVTQENFIYTANAKKNIKEVGLYFHNYDLKVKRGEHYHTEFSAENGMNSANDVSTPNEKINKTECVGYHEGRKRGGEVYTANHERVLNHDKTNSLTKKGEPYDYSPEWITYCFGSHNKYDGYAPIPNGGLYLFNRTLYNGLETSGTYYGSTEEIESQIRNGILHYYDGENNRHNFIVIESDVVRHNDFVEKIKEKGIEIGDEYNYLESDTIIEKREKHQSLINFIKDKLSNAEITECYRLAFEPHNIAKEQRRVMLTKINESEGRIPASAKGGPHYRSGVTWSREERRGLHKKRRKAYSYNWAGVGSYKISTNIEKENATINDYHYRCITSLPYADRKKLGVGDLSKTLEMDWYSKNSITTPISEIEYPKTSYSGKIVEIQNGIPTPDYINLLPLIRI